MRSGTRGSLLVVFLSGCGAAPAARPAPPASTARVPWDDAAVLAAQAALDPVAAAIVRSDETGRLSALLDARSTLDAEVRRLVARHGDLAAPVAERAQRLRLSIDRRELDLKRRSLARPATLPAAAALVPATSERPEEVVLRWPLATPEVTSPFGRRLGVHGHDGGDVKFHDGVDLRAAEGAPVLACGPGVVSEARIRGGYGLMVTLDHGLGVATHYAHLSGTDVLPGQRLAAGEVLGRAGASGRSTAPHLHLMVTVAGKKVDPIDAIGIPLGELAAAPGASRRGGRSAAEAERAAMRPSSHADPCSPNGGAVTFFRWQ